MWTNPDENGVPQTQTTQLGAPEQQVYDQRVGLAAQLGNLAANRAGQIQTTPIDFSGAPAQVTSIDPNSPTYQRAYEANLRRSLNTLDPQQAQQSRSLETNLDSRGLPIGSEGRMLEESNLGRTQATARENADLNAQQTGFTSATTDANIQNQARAQSISEILQKRNIPIQELFQFLSGSPQMQMPSAAGGANYQVQAPDIAGLTTSSSGIASQNAASQNAATAAMTAAVIGAAGSAF